MTSVTPTSDSASATAPDVEVTPRPPVVPGESQSTQDEDGGGGGGGSSNSHRLSCGDHVRSSVLSIPRKCHSNTASLVNLADEHADVNADVGAPLGYEPEGRGDSCTDRDCDRDRDCQRQTLSINCLKWAESLHALLNDAHGLHLFQRFLQQEDPDRFQMLEFWLACKGLSKQPPAQAHQLVRVIYAQLFLKAQLGIDERLRKSITQQIISGTNDKKPLSPTIFNEACAVVERTMMEVMHPNFLSSDIYLSCVQKMQTNIRDVGRTSCRHGSQSPQREAPAILEEPDDDGDGYGPVHVHVELSINQQPLPVLHEDKELTLCGISSVRRRSTRSTSLSSSSSPPPPPTTQSLSMPMDSFPTKFLRQFGSVSRSNPSRRLYNCSYNPVSRQDSELQSLSSDARTDSMSDLSLDETLCTKETYAYKRQLQRQLRSMRENANINKNSDLVFNLVPRTSNPHARESAKPLQPEEFAKVLISKLEKLKKERDAEEIVVHKLNTVEDLQNEPCAIGADAGAVSHQALSEVIVDQRNDDDSQEILDNHLARVWSDKTPRRSPSQGATPIRPKSPDGRKVWPVHSAAKTACQMTSAAAAVPPPRLPHSYVTNTAKKKDKDVCSLFSSDSGNGTDPTEGVDHRHRGANLVKSKSVPEQNEPHTSEYLSGYYQRGAAKAWSSSRRTLTDSGVSVISGSRAENITPQSPQCKEKLVSSWLLDSNRICGNRAGPGPGSVAAVATTTITAVGGGAACSVISEERDAAVSSHVKYKTRSNVVGYTPHSSSRIKIGGPPDRGNGNSSGGGGGGSACSANPRNVLPGQPFVADPSMPPFPFHSVDTDTQLEETRRRLKEMGSKLNRLPTTVATTAATLGSSKTCENSYGGGAHPQTSSKTETAATHRPNTLTRANRKTFGEESCYTTVVYNFSDEQMPYLSRLPGNPITLKQFKDYMPKKGRYRYFFVTPCEDLEMQPIQEEITDDCEFLPLWKGKVIAQIRAID